MTRAVKSFKDLRIRANDCTKIALFRNTVSAERGWKALRSCRAAQLPGRCRVHVLITAELIQYEAHFSLRGKIYKALRFLA